MLEIFGILLLCGLGYWLYARGFKNGMIKNGHVCSSVSVPPGVRYKPETMKLVGLPCFECGEIIPSEFKVIAESRENKAIFRPEVDITDHNAHMEIFHGKSTMTGK